MKVTWTKAAAERSFEQVFLDETPELIQSSLVKLRQCLEETDDLEKKQHWLAAVEKCPDLTDDEHLLMFLRCEVFDIKRSAKRVLKYWNRRVHVFGPVKAFKPLSLGQEGALCDENDKIALERGNIYFTGAVDSHGRRVIFVDPSNEDPTQYERSSMVRSAWYFAHALLQDHLVTQQKGIVFVDCPRRARFVDFDRQLMKDLVDSIQGCLPIRVAVVHICHPPAVFGFLFGIVKVFLSERLRRRVRIHSGSTEKVLRDLSKHGLDPNTLPKELLGGGDDSYDHLKWLENRRAQGK